MNKYKCASLTIESNSNFELLHISNNLSHVNLTNHNFPIYVFLLSLNSPCYKMSKQKNPIVPKKKKNPPTEQHKAALAAASPCHQATVKKQVIKTVETVKLKASCFTPTGSSQIQTLPKQEHTSVFGTPLAGPKVSCFTVRSALPSKQASLPVIGAATKGASNFTIRSALPERPPVSGEFAHPPPRPSRFKLVRRVFFYLSQLFSVHFFLVVLCCYLAGFTQWGKLMIIMGCTWNICLLTVLTALLISVRVLLVPFVD